MRIRDNINNLLVIKDKNMENQKDFESCSMPMGYESKLQKGGD